MPTASMTSRLRWQNFLQSFAGKHMHVFEDAHFIHPSNPLLLQTGPSCRERYRCGITAVAVGLLRCMHSFTQLIKISILLQFHDTMYVQSITGQLDEGRCLSEIGILFVEGFETTGHTISWTLLNLATHTGKSTHGVVPNHHC